MKRVWKNLVHFIVCNISFEVKTAEITSSCDGQGWLFWDRQKINFQSEVSGAISITIFLLCLLRLLLFQLFMSTWIFSIQTYLNSSWRFMPINWITYAFLYHHFPGSGFLVYTTLFQSQLEDLLTSINLVVTFCIRVSCKRCQLWPNHGRDNTSSKISWTTYQ